MTGGRAPAGADGEQGSEAAGERAGERGTVTLWVLYWSLSILFIAGFGLDLWRGVSVRRSLLEQAESAASAGANAVDAETFRRTGEVVIDPALAEQLARANLAAQSDADLIDQARITVDTGTQEVAVTLEGEVPFTLIKVFLSGEAPLQVGVTARAAPRIGDGGP